jgi:ribosomal protein L16 Arg81 hydroxylase
MLRNVAQHVSHMRRELEALLMARRIVRFALASLMVSAAPSGPGYSAL